MKTPKWLSLLLLLTNVSISAVYAQNERFEEKDRKLGDIYMRYAKQAYDDGVYDRVESLLAQATEFSSISRDYYVLSGLMAQRSRDLKAELDYFVKAYRMPEVNSYFEDKFIEGRIFQLFYTMRRYKELVEDYERSAVEFEFSVTPERDLYYLLALNMQERKSELASIGEKLFQTYSYDVRFYMPMFTQSNFVEVYLPRFRQLSYYAADTSPQKLTDLERSIFLASVRRVDNLQLQKEILDAAFVWLKDDVNYRNYVRSIDMFVPEVRPEDQLNSLFIDKSLLTEDQLKDLVEAGSGKIGYDTNLDGIPDQLGFFDGANGYWTYDFNQDGIPEYRIDIKNGRIEYISEQRGNMFFEWTFTRYPYVKNLQITQKPDSKNLPVRRLVYHVLQSSLKLDTGKTVEIIDQWVPIPLFTQTTGLPELWQILQHSSQLDEYYNNVYFRKNMIRGGAIYRVLEDTLGRGYFDRLLVVEDWKVVYGQRDLRNSGRFDVYEYYDNGVWQGLAYLPEEDANPSYYENWTDQIEIKIWLFDKSQYVGAYSIEDRTEGKMQVEAIVRRQMTPQELLHWKNNYMPKF